MDKINRKSIFMTGLKNKLSYVFNYRDLKEVETIIDWYENQLQRRDEAIDECIEFVKELDDETDNGVYEIDSGRREQLLEKLQQAKNK